MRHKTLSVVLNFSKYLLFEYITWPPGGRGTKYCDLRVCMPVCLSMCLSARIPQKRHVQISRNFLYMSTVARSSFDDNVLPVFSEYVMLSRNGASTDTGHRWITRCGCLGGADGDVCNRRLPCFLHGFLASAESTEMYDRKTRGPAMVIRLIVSFTPVLSTLQWNLFRKFIAPFISWVAQWT